MPRANPYQDAIDWLRSPEGEAWSEGRLLGTRFMDDGSALTRYAYGGDAELWMGGVFSVSEDLCTCAPGSACARASRARPGWTATAAGASRPRRPVSTVPLVSQRTCETHGTDADL